MRWLLVAASLTGCAGRVAPSPTSRADRTPSPARIYSIGEEQFAAGHYAEAVTLWRHAIAELPTTRSYDDLRHKLLLRLAHGQLMAWSQTGEVAFLEDAQLTLERYASRYESIFGDGQAAVSRRDEIYELLSEVELRLDPPVYEEDLDDAETVSANTSEGPALAKADEHYREGVEFRRTVVVGAEQTTVEDPRIRALLDDAFTNAEAGAVLTRPSIEPLHGPRPLLRAGGIARPVLADGERAPGARRRARKLGGSLIAEIRPALKSCYEAAYARRPVDEARSTVELELDTEGHVRNATIVEGGLVDTLGDLCLLDQLESTRLTTVELDANARIRVPLTFFYEGPVHINESTGQSAPVEVINVTDFVPGDPSERPRDRSAVDSDRIAV